MLDVLITLQMLWTIWTEVTKSLFLTYPCDGQHVYLAFYQRLWYTCIVDVINKLEEKGEMIINTGGLNIIGKGQCIGTFAGSGMGKSTLMGMIARNVKADINVTAFVEEIENVHFLFM